ncbi:hypothetical protein K431DRAFT_290272 [Polychaeton citri CBS 116435]|uniref:Reticulon-like protein n=1 Tax=Polychaeton citri CBS 116435 TaxID=1314669 RepID=A0A9P4QEG4_9PEZI|nr:hypothetical protein K431DRAFT_290272 [Polychaeton citri CBS 116435]
MSSQTAQSISSGPVAEKARTEADTTKNEFSNLAASRTTPDAQTATGQNLTHYHSMFYSLLSWENPRATGISFATVVTAIFVSRYVPIARYALKATWTALGAIAAVEVGSKTVMGSGVASRMRPKKYYTIPRETLENALEDVEQFINFFVIEIQRVVFAENVWATIAAFAASLVTYFLIKVTPAWGLALLGTVVLYLGPLIYIKNRELIDGHLNNANQIVSDQTQQLRSLAAQHSNKALDATKNAAGSYATKAQEMVGHAKRQAVDKGYVSKETAEKVPSGGAGSSVQSESFPSAPQTEPAPAVADTAAEIKKEAEEPLLA